MKMFFTIVILLFASNVNSQENVSLKTIITIDKVQALKDTLVQMSKQTDNQLFINHCNWFSYVIDAQETLTLHDSTVLSATYDTFCIKTNFGNCRKFSSYLNRERPLIIAWQSPTDGKVSFSTLILPKDWDPEKTYPLYIQLHGLSSTAHLPIDYLTRYFLKVPNSSYAYEDGYLLSPWGRGNLWYQGISETDIWECKAAFESIVKIDPKRQYLKGHSMGGYGAWSIASRSAGTWAALGIQAGALWYGGENMLKDEIIQQLKDLPTYFVTGTNDGLLTINQKAYNLLNNAGNTHINFVTFVGGHEHLDSNEEEMYLWMKDFVNEDYTSIPEDIDHNTNGIECFPNPFKNSTTFKFNLERNCFVELSIYNSEGKLLKTIVSTNLKAGTHEINFDGTELLSGIYCGRLDVEGKQTDLKIFIKAN